MISRTYFLHETVYQGKIHVHVHVHVHAHVHVQCNAQQSHEKRIRRVLICNRKTNQRYVYANRSVVGKRKKAFFGKRKKAMRLRYSGMGA